MNVHSGMHAAWLVVLTWSTAVLLAASPRPALAQNTITLEGRVVGDSGAPIASAQIGVRNVETNETRQAVSRADGAFRLLGLFSGRYEITARAIGFKPATDLVQLVIGQRAFVTITMQRRGTEIAGMTVTAERVKSVEVQRMSVSSPVLKQEIENLPLNSRGVMNLASIAPGVKSYAPQQGRALPSAGAAPDLRFINLYMDGVEMKSLYNGNLVGIPQTGSPLPQEALEEFRVYTTPYDAEYSRAGSYVISAVSRRGTNKWEGSAFEFFQNKDFVGRTFIQKQSNQQLADFGRNQLGFNVRGPLQKDRLFLAASYELTDIKNYIDVTPGRPAFNPTLWDSFRGSVKAPNTNHTAYLRMTMVPNVASTYDLMVSSRYLTGESNFGGIVVRDGGINQKYWINTAELRQRYLATNNLVNEASAQLVSWYHNEAPLRPGPTFTYPNLTIGTSGFPLELRETHLRAVDRLTYTKDNFGGSHVFKTGVEVEHVKASQFNPTNEFGTFNFNTDTSANPNTASVSVGFFDPATNNDSRLSLSGWVTGFYANDEWRPVPNFTLNLGLRYDAEINTLDNDFTVPWASDPVLTSLPALDGWLNRGDRENDLNNLSPRISFSWDPLKNNRTFLRGGFGIIYDRVTSFIGFQERSSAAWRTYNFQNPGTTDPAVLRERVVGGTVAVTPQLILVKHRMETPENHQFSLGVGHQFTEALGINVDYVQQRMSHLYVRRNPNYFDTQLARRALTAKYGDIILWDDFGRAQFDGVVAQGTYSRGTTRVNLAYTLGWYKADFDGNLANAFPFPGSYSMQYTSGDERHRVVLSEVAKIPFGIMLSSIITAASPRPYAVTDGRDLNRDNATFDDFPNGVRIRRPSNSWTEWYKTVDLRLARNLVSLGTRSVGITAEVFNLFNAENRSAYGNRQFDASGGAIASFGTPTGAFAARQGQLGLKMSF